MRTPARLPWERRPRMARVAVGRHAGTTFVVDSDLDRIGLLGQTPADIDHRDVGIFNPRMTTTQTQTTVAPS